MKNNTQGVIGFLIMMAVLAAIAVSGLFAGCTSYKGGSYHDGIAIQMGARIPVSEQVQLTLFNFCTGTVFLFDSDAAVSVHTSQTNSVSFLGLYSSSTVKSADVVLEPCEGEVDGEEEGKMP